MACNVAQAALAATIERRPLPSGIAGHDAPARQRRVVADPGVHPAHALGSVFLFPERRLGLEVVDQKLAGLKALPPVGTGHGHQHDLLERLQPPDAVDDARANDVEAPHRLIDHRLDGFFGHAGIMLQLDRQHGIARVLDRQVNPPLDRQGAPGGGGCPSTGRPPREGGFLSRTTPTKLQTAPTPLFSRRKAAISLDRSKSWVWMTTRGRPMARPLSVSRAARQRRLARALKPAAGGRRRRKHLTAPIGRWAAPARWPPGADAHARP